MCFRPPEAGAGEMICRSCYTIVEPNPDGACPECGEPMGNAADVAAQAGGGEPPAAPTAPAVPGSPPAPGGE